MKIRLYIMNFFFQTNTVGGLSNILALFLIPKNKWSRFTRLWCQETH